MEPSAELAKIIGPLLMQEDGSTAPATSQATLFLARDLTGKEVVLKRTAARSKEQLESAQNEVSLLRKIRHPNVVGFYGVWFRPLQPYGTEVNLLLELCPGGHLLDLQRRREHAGRPLTEQEIVRLFVQCCRGVECLHRFDPPVAHRDVKLENLLLGGEDGRTVKLCDFGSATTRRTLVTTKEDRAKLEDEILRLTTPCYRAPEMVDLYSRRLVSEQVDIWALGCVLYALAFGRHAFGEDGSTLAILNNKYVIPKEPYYSQEFKVLFVWLLESDPNQRPRIGDVVDELDTLLGNRIKVPAERRGSGNGSRSDAKMPVLELMQKKATLGSLDMRALGTFSPGAVPPSPPKRSPKTPTGSLPPPPAAQRGAAFVNVVGANKATAASQGARAGAMESRRAVGQSQQQQSQAVKVTVSGPGAAPDPLPVPFPTNPPVPAAARISNNPFDDLPPSANPTFFSTPGMRSTSVAGFPDEIFSADVGSPFDAPAQGFLQSVQSQLSFFGPSASSHTLPNSRTASSTLALNSLPPSHAPIFYSDPPPQWRPSKAQ